MGLMDLSNTVTGFGEQLPWFRNGSCYDITYRVCYKGRRMPNDIWVDDDGVKSNHQMNQMDRN